MLRRRGFLAGLGALLAAPAIVRAESIMRVATPKLITPDDAEFTTDNLKVRAYESFALGWHDWRGTWGSADIGVVHALDPLEADAQTAIQNMKRMRQIEDEMARELDRARAAAMTRLAA
jgi:hypothetical protein